MQNEDNATGKLRCKQGRKTKYKAACKPLFKFMNQVTELITPTELVQNKLQHIVLFSFYMIFVLCPFLPASHCHQSQWTSEYDFLVPFLSSQLYPQPQLFPFVTFFF